MDFNVEKKGYDISEVDEYIKKLTHDYELALSEQKQRIHELKKALSQSEAVIKSYKEKSNLVTKAIINAVQKAEEIDNLSRKKYSQEIEQLKAFHEKWMSYYNRILEKYPLDEDLAAAQKFNVQMKQILSRTNNIQDGKAAEHARVLEKNFESEKERLSEKRIGYITVKASEKSDEDDDVMRQLLPDMDTSSPILSGNFDPIERINKYLSAEKAKVDTTQQTSDGHTAATKEEEEDKFTDRSELGFSFQEALNPTDDLSQIMRDLGLLLDEKK